MKFSPYWCAWNAPPALDPCPARVPARAPKKFAPRPSPDCLNDRVLIALTQRLNGMPVAFSFLASRLSGID